MKKIVRPMLLGVVIAVSAVTLSAHDPFSLTVVLRDDSGDAIRSDGGVYVDRGDAGGRTPTVYSNSYGNIDMDLRGSSRLLCLTFDTPLTTPGALAPRSDCYPAFLRTLANAESGGVTDLEPSADATFSMVIYWTGPGADGRTRDYSVAFRRADGSGITAAASADGQSWTISPLTGVGRVSAYLSGKNGGWNVVGDYAMPFALTAQRQSPNLRARGKG